MSAYDAETQSPGSEADGDGVYHLAVGGQSLSVMEVPETGQAVVWSSVGDLPPEGREMLYRTILEAMSPDGESDDMILSVEPASQLVYLHWLGDLVTLDVTSFKTRLTAFAGFLEHWKTAIGDFRPQLGSPESNAGEGFSPISGPLGGYLQV